MSSHEYSYDRTAWNSLSFGHPDGSDKGGFVSMVFENWVYTILVVYDPNGEWTNIEINDRRI